MYSRSRGSSHDRRRGRDQLGQVHQPGEIHALARGQGLHHRAIGFAQRERNDIHGIEEEIAIRVGQADQQGAASRSIINRARRRAQALVSHQVVRARDHMVRSRFHGEYWGENGRRGAGLTSQK